MGLIRGKVCINMMLQLFGKKELYQKIYRSIKEDGVFILGDYIACCDEEEELLRDVYMRRRKQSDIPESRFVHFDLEFVPRKEYNICKFGGVLWNI